MICSVSIDGIEWSLDFGQDSVTLTVKDLVHERTKSSQELALAARSLLLSQRLDFSNNHHQIFPNQEGTMDKRDKVLSSIGAQDMDTIGFQLSDLDEVDFFGKMLS